jgi:CheY-like chemotaxis protein/anti-sigma regulatory factor (Ser/Thr protein kinase)
VRLVDDLLDVSRVSQGKVVMKKAVTSLQAVVDQALETAKPLVDAAGHTLEVQLPHDPLLLHVDPTRIAQVLANLLNNAAKYTPERGDIRLEAQDADGQVRITVTDNGAGIPAQMLPHVFDMFTQGEDTLARAQGGLGIGLTLVRQLALLHGGDVVAHSDGPGRGSSFCVTLPTLRSEQDEAQAAPSAHASAEQPLRVLVADDNVDAANTLTMLLELMGHECTAVHDGAAAVEAFQRVRPDVVLLDIGMPRMDGYQVARELRRLQGGQRPRIVALTGWGAAADRQRTKDAGFDLHLTKPVEYGALQAALAG